MVLYFFTTIQSDFNEEKYHIILSQFHLQFDFKKLKAHGGFFGNNILSEFINWHTLYFANASICLLIITLLVKRRISGLFMSILEVKNISH